MENQEKNYNADLKKLYNDYWKGLKEIKKNDCRFSEPWLMKLIPEYGKKPRLFVIGQEALNCCGGSDVDKLMNEYFRFRKEEVGKSYHPPFWRAIRYLENRLDLNVEDCSAVSNLIRLDPFAQDPKKEKTDQFGIYEQTPELINISKIMLQKEIEICNPNLIIFFTGPYYEQFMPEIFKKCDWETLESGDYVDSANRKKEYWLKKSNIAEFNCPVYWTWHPKHLDSCTAPIRDKILNRIVKDFKD